MRLKKTRDAIISTKKIEGVEVTYEEHEFWNDNYKKILDETKRIYDDDQKAKQELFELELEKQKVKLLEEEREREEKEQQKQENKENVGCFIMILFLIVGGGFFFFCMISEKIWLFFVVSCIFCIICSILISIINLFKD